MMSMAVAIVYHTNGIGEEVVLDLSGRNDECGSCFGCKGQNKWYGLHLLHRFVLSGAPPA